MEIHSLYKLFLNRLREPGQKTQPPLGEKAVAPQTAPGDRREFSSLLAALREAECLDRQTEPADAARLKKLQEEIEQGLYEINTRRLAEAMLRSPGDLPARRGENR